MRFFEVVLNGNFFCPAFTLQCKLPKTAVKIALKEATANRNDNFTIIEVDEQGWVMENGYYFYSTTKLN